MRLLPLLALPLLALLWLSGEPGRILAVAAVLLVAPGYLLARALRLPRDLPLTIRAALWVGLSLCAVALLYQWAGVAGVPLRAPLLAVLLGGCAVGALFHPQITQITQIILGARAPATPPRAWGQGVRGLARADLLIGLALLAVLALTGWTRVTQIAGLAFPPWVDSVHHALLVRIMAETGAPPLSLRPWLEVDRLPYHYGYHAGAAAVLSLSGAALPATLLWYGQLLNALHALGAAAAARWLWRSPVAALGAALVVGLVSIYPAFYLSWGRYTQLTGLLLLYPLLICWDAGLRGHGRRWWATAAILLAGLSLVHFRVLLVVLALLAALTVVRLVAGPRRMMVSGPQRAAALRDMEPRPPHHAAALRNMEPRPPHHAAALRNMVVAGVAALLLAAPWLWFLAQTSLGTIAAQPGLLAGPPELTALNPGVLWAWPNVPLAALALAAALAGCARRDLSTAALALWIALLAGMANPQFLGLRASWLLTNEVVSISLFVPLGLLTGAGLAWLWDARWRSVTRPALALVCAAAALWGTVTHQQVVNPGTVFATAADARALAWVQANTPPDARFWINAAPWQPDAARGTDGGWWLLPIAGRWTSTPPVLFVYGPPEAVAAARARSSAALTARPADLWPILLRDRIDYLYFGPVAGRLSAPQFIDDQRLAVVYQADGVTILAVRGQP